MKNIKTFNESIRDDMKPKSEEDIDQAVKDVFNKVSPFSALAFIMKNDLDKYEDIVWEKIEEEKKVLDNIFTKHKAEYASLSELVQDVASWVEKNDGDPASITLGGFNGLVEIINKYEFAEHDLIETFKKFLKSMAISEVSSNNKHLKAW